MKKFLLLFGFFAYFGAVAWLAAAPTHNGFDLSNSIIPADQILRGGPAKNGIPSIDHPQFIAANTAEFIKAKDRVLGLNYRGISKAYPIKIMNWHEIVNDTFQDTAITVTFCPLCGSGIAYLGSINGETYDFGVSGLLYNSDILLFDRKTESLWSQLMNQAISGPMRGTRLTQIALSHTSWLDWKTRHPNTVVMTENTGHFRNYQINPYQSYKLDKKLLFPVAKTSDSYHAKELVLGVELNGAEKVYPFSEMNKMPATFKDALGEQIITINFSKQHMTATLYDSNNQELPSVITFWFAWYAFHPESQIFKSKSAL